MGFDIHCRAGAVGDASRGRLVSMDVVSRDSLWGICSDSGSYSAVVFTRKPRSIGLGPHLPLSSAVMPTRHGIYRLIAERCRDVLFAKCFDIVRAGVT